VRLISKSTFLNYLTCPKDAWFRMHKPELDEFKVSETQQNIFDLGYEVEEYAKQLNIFSGMIEVVARGAELKKEVDNLISKKTPAIYQATFIAEDYLIRCDMLVWNKLTSKWDLYEIKASSSRKDTGERDHISDVSFQTIVLEKYGVPIDKKYVVHLNSEYVRKGKINVEELFVMSDCTQKVEERKLTIVGEMEQAKEYLNQEKEPKNGCDCLYYGRSSHCATFYISHPDIPKYSVHDLVYIGKSRNKLKQLVEQGIYNLQDINDVSEFTNVQQNQIQTYKSNSEIIVLDKIANIINGYNYPLCFLDYETFAPSIPIYDGFSPYKRIPIQFSLHIIDKKGGPLRHLEYLHQENSDPSEIIAKYLIENIEPEGTVLAWNVGFEKSVTIEIASRLPEYKITLQRICGQMQDLMDIFSKQYYIHKDFKGRANIEVVMNVLLPEMTYDNLPYTGQDVGFVWWKDIANKGLNIKERDKKIHLIKEYCKQDTFVMVDIFRILNGMINKK